MLRSLVVGGLPARALIRAGLTILLVACDAEAPSPSSVVSAAVDLQVVKTADKGAPAEGDSLIYIVTVTNKGPVSASSVAAVDSYPAGITIGSQSATLGTFDTASRVWTIGSLAVNANATLTLRTKVKTGTANTQLVNKAGARGTQADSISSNDTASVRITVQAVVSGGEPVDPGSGYIWSENFDRYTDVLSMGRTGSCPPAADGIYGRRTLPNSANSCTPDAGIFELPTGRSGTGKAMRVNYPTSGSQQNHNILSPYGGNWAANYLTASGFGYPAKGTIVFQYWFRITAGWSPGAAGMKWFEMWTGGSVNDRTQLSPATGTDANPIWHIEPSLSSRDFAFQPVGPYWSAVNDGQWHRFTALYKPNTTYAYPSASSRDGRIAMWLDGQKMMECSQGVVGVTPPGGTGPWCDQDGVDRIPGLDIDFVKLPDNLNGLNRPPGSIDIEDLKVWALP